MTTLEINYKNATSANIEHSKECLEKALLFFFRHGEY